MKKKSSLAGFISEPLFHFIVIGAFIFLADYIFSSNGDSHYRIIIDQQRMDDLSDIFIEGQRRQPSEEELDRMIVKWTQNEIFFREAKMLGLDKGDEMIRSRLILKMRNVILNNTTPETPTEKELEDWFNLNRQKYENPETFDFEQVLVRDQDNNLLHDGFESVEHQLNISNNRHLPNALNKELRRYLKRPQKSISAIFGDQNGERLIDAELGEWIKVTSDKGVHLARITAVYAPRPIKIEDVKSRLIADWKKTQADFQLAKKTTAIAEKYKVELTGRVERTQDETLTLSLSASN